MLSARVQQSPCLVDLAWLDRNSCLTRLVGSWLIKSMKVVMYCSAELNEVDRRDHDRYWNTIENTIALPDRNSESEKLFILILLVS